EVTAELVEAQKRSEERIARLEKVTAELVEAHKRSEERIARLEKVTAELVEAQKRLEERQARFEHEITERVSRLESKVAHISERLERLSDTVGYTLEDRAYRSLPKLLAEDGVEVIGRLRRIYLKVRGRQRQLNIYGHGRRGDEEVLILGEAKTRPSRREVDRFVRLIRAVEEQEGVRVYPIFVAYDFPPEIEAYIRQKGIRPIWSYELDV
ncbi:MAG: hypothetical protein GXO36_06070, partial [Chloroflexi bacterium]|nr:hypothetical protein [Chloroflexota bacterium]